MTKKYSEEGETDYRKYYLKILFFKIERDSCPSGLSLGLPVNKHIAYTE
jgi:hypothetical protein